MRRVRHTDLQAARDLYYAYVQYVEEQKVSHTIRPVGKSDRSQTLQGQNYFTRLIELITIPRCRRASLAAGTVMLAQQMCGINIIAFYSASIFVEGGLTSSQALYASIGFGALSFVFALPAVFLIDTYGRRSLLLATFPNVSELPLGHRLTVQMCWTLLGGAMCFYIEDRTTRTALVALFVYLFSIFYALGEGPVPFMYAAEVFPLKQREQGAAMSVMWTFAWAGVLSLTVRVFSVGKTFGLTNSSRVCFEHEPTR